MGSNELSSFNCSSSCKCVHGSGRRREGGEGPFFHFSPFQLYFFVKCYNRHMGGVDLLNQAINCYRIRVRIRKWYWKIFTWMIDLACTNAYERISYLRCGKRPPASSFEGVSSCRCSPKTLTFTNLPPCGKRGTSSNGTNPQGDFVAKCVRLTQFTSARLVMFPCIPTASLSTTKRFCVYGNSSCIRFYVEF